MKILSRRGNYGRGARPARGHATFDPTRPGRRRPARCAYLPLPGGHARCTGSTRAAGRPATTTRPRRRATDGISVAEPETIDAFETGLDGAGSATRSSADCCAVLLHLRRLPAVHDRGRLRHAARVRGALGRQRRGVRRRDRPGRAAVGRARSSRCAAAGSRAASWTSSQQQIVRKQVGRHGGHADPRDRQHRQPPAQLTAVQGQRHGRAGDPARQLRRADPALRRRLDRRDLLRRHRGARRPERRRHVPGSRSTRSRRRRSGCTTRASPTRRRRRTP